ncbi:hypothetical protein CXF92_12645 [Pseudomonas sp. Choline-3u-10]|uniref:hypothetical protein n=1 Tax=Pseudomonas sp. Choline-3u-10 TaxID=2058311 RepID=UPI000C33B6B7|nr:hypothetical protein [Pseudomonas sp. Choline-3u-10]PKG93624.1 hypothetical protein CXF92_12645 [Pseudomonas sp. Choline-3u-10]|tara:strand:+ start:12136 stop:12366 length:231 start_codon:yes stop_codon:yes gene_type:complete
MSRTPICDAIAADPARYLFKTGLQALLAASGFAERDHYGKRLAGHLDGLMEAEIISREQFRVAANEINAFVWEQLP